MAAFAASAARLLWAIVDAVKRITGRGRELNLAVDSPAAIKLEVDQSVRRWRWRNVERKHASLDSGGWGSSVCMEPIWKQLRLRSIDGWGGSHKGMAASVIPKRQWPQHRCYMVGKMVEHNKCCICVFGGGLTTAPVGTMRHRNWHCNRNQHARSEYAPSLMMQRVVGDDGSGNLALDRGLLKSVEHWVPAAASEATSHWHTKPRGGVIEGTVYSDGFQLDGHSPLMRRCRWAFVAVDRYGNVIAAAYGLPPSWVSTIGGAEAWALYQAAAHAILGTDYRVD